MKLCLELVRVCRREGKKRGCCAVGLVLFYGCPQPHEDFLCVLLLCASRSSFVLKVSPQHSYFAFLLD